MIYELLRFPCTWCGKWA